MAVQFPTNLDDFTNPATSDTLDSPSHAGQHTDANDAIEALEAKVGKNSSAVTTSHDYKLSGVTGTDKAVSKTGTEVLTNKTLTTPVINGAVTGTITPPLTFYGANFYAPEGFLLNGKIVPSVASNNLTVAIKGLDGNNPSATNPIYVRIGDTIRSITSALSVTKNAGTNWCNAGSAELATKEIDYFVYLGYNATDGVVIGFSRIPYATEYSQFSTTTTNEKYCAISTITNAAAGDDYVVIGRFAATLSAGAGYTWSVPTFTSINLIQRPIYESRWLNWIPSWTLKDGTLTTTYTVRTGLYKIKQYESTIKWNMSLNAVTTATANAPFNVVSPVLINNISEFDALGFCTYFDAGTDYNVGVAVPNPSSPTTALSFFGGDRFGNLLGGDKTLATGDRLAGQVILTF